MVTICYSVFSKSIRRTLFKEYWRLFLWKILRSSHREVFWKYAVNSQENTHAEVSFATLLKPLLHRYSPVHWLHIFRTHFLKNTSGQLLLNTTHSCLLVMPIWRKRNQIYQNFFLIMMQKNLLKRKTCFKSPLNLGYIDLFIPNSVCSFQNTATVACG